MEYELNESFSITNDKLADWALRKIRDEEEERNRLIEIANDQIAELNLKISQINDRYNEKTKFLKSHLAIYFDKVPHNDTKTQESYKLLSGSLVRKKPSVKITYDDDKLLEYLIANDGDEYIKTKRSIDWAEFKKQLAIIDGEVIDKELGTVIPSDTCTIEEVPASFDIKIN